MYISKIKFTSLLNKRLVASRFRHFIRIQAYFRGKMITLALAGIILTMLCICIAWKRVELCQIMAEFPGPKAWPIVGNALQLKRDPHGKIS